MRSPDDLAALEYRLKAICDRIRDPVVRRHYKAFFKRKLQEMQALDLIASIVAAIEAETP